jgi:ribosomal protein S10
MKLKVILKSFDQISLMLYKKFLTFFFKKHFITIHSIVLPIKKRRISVLKSPHVDKRAMEQFEVKIYKCNITCILSKNLYTKYIKMLFINKPKNIKLIFRLIQI